MVSEAHGKKVFQDSPDGGSFVWSGGGSGCGRFSDPGMGGGMLPGSGGSGRVLFSQTGAADIRQTG